MFRQSWCIKKNLDDIGIFSGFVFGRKSRLPRGTDHVHLVEEVRKLQAAFLAGALEGIL